MMHYLFTHFLVSALFLLPVLFLARSNALSNKLRLVLLYLILIKIILPWGIIDFVTIPFKPIAHGGGISLDTPYDVITNISGTSISVFTLGHWIALIWGSLFLMNLIFTSLSFHALNVKVRNASVCNDAYMNTLIATEAQSNHRKNPVAILLSKSTPLPFIWWNKQWFIILPTSVLSMPRVDKKVILAHEHAHIKRNDFIKFIMLRLVKALFFFSPVVLLLIKEILEREETETDLTAMRLFSITPSAFGKTILHTIRTSNPVRYPVPALRKSTKRRLKMRLEGLFPNSQTTKRKWIRTSVLSSLLILMVVNFPSAATLENTSSESAFIIPVASGKLTLPYGQATHPITKKQFMHKGIDLAAPMSTTIVAPAKGQVTKIDYNDAQGHFMIMRHDDGYTTLYSHLSEVMVSQDSTVEQGDAIAKVGNSGRSTGPHLHFEVHKDNETIDPLTVITYP